MESVKPEEKEEDKEVHVGAEACDTPFPLTVTSRVLYLLGDITAGPAYKLTQWLELVRRRSARHRLSGFPHHPHRTFNFVQSSRVEALLVDAEARLDHEECTDISLWERLGKASILNIEAGSFSWNMLSSLHHTEHTSCTENVEDETSKALEVTVNSGGVVFFSFFRPPGIVDASTKEAVAVIKISSSRMATQSERLGYEFAKWLGVKTPQARVIHSSSPEWLQIKEAAEKAREVAIYDGDEIGETTCTELLEALELSRCLFFMSYVHGSPLSESSQAFASQKAAEKTAAGLGRILLLDLVIRNEDRLPCRQLWWRGNPANLLYAEKTALVGTDALEEAYDSAVKHYRPRVIKALQKERRATSVDSKVSSHNGDLVSQSSDLSDISASPKSINMIPRHEVSNKLSSADFHIVAIDSVVPRRPPAGKRANDQLSYPKLVELLLNSSEYSSNLLHELSGGKLGSPLVEDGEIMNDMGPKVTSIVYEFRNGFRAALRDMQGFHIFLLTLHQKLECSLRSFMNIINRSSSVDFDKEELMVPESPSHTVGVHCASPTSREQAPNDNAIDVIDMEAQKTGPRSSSSASKENSDCNSPHTREFWHGKCCRGSGEPLRSLRLSAKLRDFHKLAKVDAESSKDLEQWSEMFRNDAIKLCLENNFNTGYFEGNDNNIVVDAYELKVRLEHILERIALISEAANTEKPSSITNSLFIGGALAARSVFTLQHFNISHILCLCANEIGQSDSQYPDLFNYKNFSIVDEEDVNISRIFNEACDFIDHVEQIGGKVLVHCFEGRSRSATVVIAYLMLRKNFTLLKAWNTLRRVHRRAHPNDGFAKILLDLDRKLHGQVSMEWHQRKPAMKVCPICGKNAGLSSSSLKLHLQKAHKKLSSGSVDSAMTMEIQKALSALKVNRSGSVSPTNRRTPEEMDE